MIFGPSDAEFEVVFEGTKSSHTNNDQNNVTQIEDLRVTPQRYNVLIDHFVIRKRNSDDVSYRNVTA